MSTISLNIVFQGGLDTLFDGQRHLQVSIPASVSQDNSTPAPGEAADPGTLKPADITYLIHYLRDHHLKERVELFMQDGTVRPGILVMVNDTDWELEGEGDYVLKDKDEIVFISTLHGG